MTEEQDSTVDRFEPPESEDVGVELELPSGEVSTDETCGNCSHVFQGECQRNSGIQNPVNPNGHCSLWGKR